MPGDADTLKNPGAALSSAGRSGEAVSSYRRALPARTDHAEAHNNLGSALRSLEQFDEAIASLHRALEIKPEFADALANIWELRFGTGGRRMTPRPA